MPRVPVPQRCRRLGSWAAVLHSAAVVQLWPVGLSEVPQRPLLQVAGARQSAVIEQLGMHPPLRHA